MPELGASHPFGRIDVDWRGFRELKGTHVLAANASLVGVDGTVPFDRYAIVGGSRIMRGYPAGRFRDKWVGAVQGKAKAIREGKDPAFEKSRGLFKALPFFVLRPLLKLVDVLTNEFHLHLPGQGMPRDPFGTAVITNVGMFGIDTAFVVTCQVSRILLVLTVGPTLFQLFGGPTAPPRSPPATKS